MVSLLSGFQTANAIVGKYYYCQTQPSQCSRIKCHYTGSGNSEQNTHVHNGTSAWTFPWQNLLVAFIILLIAMTLKQLFKSSLLFMSLKVLSFLPFIASQLYPICFYVSLTRCHLQNILNINCISMAIAYKGKLNCFTPRS